jgi:predicted amidohydrolase YtcJ
MPVFAPETLTREFLDQLIPDRPAFIEDETGGHTAWINTLAMGAAGISRDTPDTPESLFSRTKDGDLSDMAFERGLNPFLETMPPFDTAYHKIAFMKLLDEATSKGITAVGDAYVFEHDLQAFQELKQDSRLRQHMVLYLKSNLGTPELTPVEELLEWWNSYDLPDHKAVKIGMDGSIESFSAPLIDGYVSNDAPAMKSPMPADQLLDNGAGENDNVRPIVPESETQDHDAPGR